MRRSVLWTLIGVAIAVVLVVAGVLVVTNLGGSGSSGGSECDVPAVPGDPVTVVVEGSRIGGAATAGSAELGASASPATQVTMAPDVYLEAVQLQNASTINAVGIQRGVPQRARVIAVATAWQESKLRNLPGGDRDSVGLFQQRPSQGWGTAAQISDPIYASGKFFDALLAIDGWERMSLTAAAQSVQFSAYPDAYAQWEPNATTLVRALSGGDPVALSCRDGAQKPTASVPSRAAAPGTANADSELAGLLASGSAEFGGITVQSLDAGGKTAILDVKAEGLSDDEAARAFAAWTVSHSAGFDVSEIAVGGQVWQNHSWSQRTEAMVSGQVSITVRPAGTES